MSSLLSSTSMNGSAIPRKGILILVENLPVPFDRRVWMQATTLQRAGYRVTVICPRGPYASDREIIDGVAIYRYPLPSLPGIVGHLAEYAVALVMTFVERAELIDRRFCRPRAGASVSIHCGARQHCVYDDDVRQDLPDAAIEARHRSV